ncbi:hypothetical protein L3Y34_008819 [Caenorhabditis briggsae]|uniref:Uncharacterized protein n=1 Tax=Caenorhabditis briggsae TaxID=6238 RepID=A0AAE9AAM5_CAEBR|nr:hypothetical protein L3Y34_008819 [Caenorhabditis briggsae]
MATAWMFGIGDRRSDASECEKDSDWQSRLIGRVGVNGRKPRKDNEDYSASVGTGSDKDEGGDWTMTGSWLGDVGRQKQGRLGLVIRDRMLRNL